MQAKDQFITPSTIHNDLVFISFPTLMSVNLFNEKISYLSYHLNNHVDVKALIFKLMSLGGIKVYFCDLQFSRAIWRRDQRIILIRYNIINVQMLDSLIFELCNANNIELNKISYTDYHSSEQYAETIEEVEFRTVKATNELVTKGVTLFGWPDDLPSYKHFRSFNMTQAKKGSVCYNGYSHYHLNMKFHNDHMLNKARASLANLENLAECDEIFKQKVISEIYERKKLKLELKYNAKKFFPIYVIEDYKANNEAVDCTRYIEELKEIELWYVEKYRKIEVENYQLVKKEDKKVTPFEFCIYDQSFWKQRSSLHDFPEGIVAMQRSVITDGIQLSELQSVARTHLEASQKKLNLPFFNNKEDQTTKAFYHVIMNASTLEELQNQVERFHREPMIFALGPSVGYIQCCLQ